MSSVSFDPYHKWLGIPSSEQPAHHYRLLGIPAFEDDPQVIEAAADRQMAFLRRFQSGEHAADATRVLNELSRARLCLLKPTTKTAYDAELKSVLDSTEQAQRSSGLPLWRQPAALGTAATAFVALIVAIVIVTRPGLPATAPQQPVGKDNRSGDRPAAGTADVSALPPARPHVVATSDSSKSGQTQRDRQRPHDVTGNSTANKSAVAATNGAANPKSAVPGRSRGQTERGIDLANAAGVLNVDLLQQIDLDRDTVGGDWQSDPGVLIGTVESPAIARLIIPATVPAEYDLFLTVERKVAKGSFLIGLPVQTHRCVAVLETGARNDLNGLSEVDGQPAQQNASTKRGKCLPLDEPAPIVCRVRRNSVRIEINHRAVVNWRGAAARLTAPESISGGDSQGLLLAIQGSSFRITDLRLKEIEQTDSATAEEAGLAATERANQPAEGVLTIERLLTPDAAAQDTARRQVREKLKIEYGLAKKADPRNFEPRIALAKTLYAQAQDKDDDPAACFVMLYDAAELASEAGQLGLAWEILQTLGERFDMTPLPLMQRAAKAARPFARNAEDIGILASMYVRLLEAAIQNDDFDTAGKASQEVSSITRKIPVLKEQLAIYARRVGQLREAFELAKPARDHLTSQPDDGPANLSWGRYLCFFKGDWTAGLPCLTKASDPSVADLARREMAKPREVAELEQLGDDWWQVADTEVEFAQNTLRNHAGEFWQQALSAADEQQSQQLHDKIARLFEPTRMFITDGSGQGIAVSNPDLNPGLMFTIEFWVMTKSTRAILLSKRQQSNESSIVVAMNDGRAVLGSSSSDGNEQAPSRVIINDGHWHHIALVKLGQRLGLFVDGKAVAHQETAELFKSNSPWKLGYQADSRYTEPQARFCRLRFSKEARYLVNFLPEKNYGKDKSTILVPPS